MIHKSNIICFLAAMMYVSLLSSCISREEYIPELPDLSGYIEFVARPTSYNGQTVHTKATSVDDFENRIHNCYFLLFDSNGQRVFDPVDMNAMFTTQRVSRHEILSKLGSQTTCTACFIANVPVDAVNRLTTVAEVNSAVLDISYTNADVQDAGDGNKPSSFVVPEFDLDGSGASEPVQCIPMFGMASCDLSGADLFQVPVKRLFAKVSVNVSVAVTRAEFDIMAAHLFNLPIRVRLAESDTESAWIRDASAFLPHQIEGPIDDDDIVGGMIGRASDYEFYFYVPEYYLQPLAASTPNYGNEKYKPQMFDQQKRPVFVRLFGTYNNDSNITYDLYLGENNATSFTLKRNVHYMNSMNIQGITNSKTGSGATLDCRVEVTTEEFDEVEVLGQTANCYIIGQPGTYRYPACKGVFKGGVNNIPENMKCSKGTRLKQLYIDNSSVRIDNLNYDEETREFSFELVSLDGGGGLLASNDANVILGLVYDEGGQEKIEWSWHIWIQSGTTLDLNLGFFDFSASNQTYPNGAIMMDRNLGARPTTLEYPGVEPGAYYKYGHKEPFLGTVYWGGGESQSYDWSGSEKSVTDPCPPGYRVPASSVWSGSATKQHLEMQVAGIGFSAFQYWDGGTASIIQIQDDILYPYSGYIGQDLKKKELTPAYTLRGNYPDEVMGVLMKAYDINYSLKINKSSGVLVSADNKEVAYEGVSQGLLSNVVVESCKYKIGTSIFGYEIWGSEQTYNGSGTIIDALLTIIEGVLQNEVQSIQDAIKPVFNASTIRDQSYGYQVRCVRE